MMYRSAALMASVNPLSRELVFKIVYYGPGLGGKTTTLEHLHATAKAEHRGKLVSLATPVDRTLYFDFLPMRLPPIRGMNVRLQLFTVPGQVYFNATRKLVLTGADGIVFVSDAQIVRADANLESLENLRENLAEQGRDLGQMPIVFQHNKSDLPDLLPYQELDSMLNPFGAPSLPTCAKTGEGIYEGLQKISEAVLTAFESKLPESLEGGVEASFAEIEGGLVTALRDASAGEREPPSDIVIARISAPGTAYPSVPPGSGSIPPPSAPPPPPIADAEPPVSHRAPDSVPLPLVVPDPAIADGAGEEASLDLPPFSSLPRQGDRARPGAGVGSPSSPGLVSPGLRGTSGGVSFAELWPEGEQETVREVEEAITRGRYWRAIELCESLVARVLASAAGLFGSSEAPRDAAVVPILLGLDARRYLAFRSIVREARGDGLITAREALAAFAFAIDARIARSSIHY
jgi:mutual gliding-motility protein MglA